MKKLLIISLAIIMILSTILLVACQREVVYVYEQVGGGGVQGGNGGNVNQGGTVEDNEGDGSSFKLTVWCAEEDKNMIREMLDAYEDKYPSNKYDFTLATVGEDVVSSAVTRDIEAAADVFSYANDQVGILMNQQALYRIPEIYNSQIESQIGVAKLAARSGSYYYGIPYSYENCFLYYNTSLVSEEDVKSMETLLSKSIPGVTANLGIDMSDSYYTTMFLYTAGVEVFGPQGTDPESIELATQNAMQACEYIQYLGGQKKLDSIGKEDQVPALTGKKVAAMISGPHMISQFKKALGANFGVAMLPTIKLNGKDTQLVSFSGVKMYGVSNKTSRDQKTTAEACKVAAFLANKENQQTRLEEREFCPTENSLFKAAKESGLKTVEVVVNQSEYSKLKPGISRMNSYWTPMANFLNGVYKLTKSKDVWLTELESIEKTIRG